MLGEPSSSSEAGGVEVDIEADHLPGVAALEDEVDFEHNFKTFRKKASPIKLSWQDLEYSVAMTKGPAKRKVILKKISGEANPGEVVALMGPSGSGKTTLLNVLAGRITGGHDGKILTGAIAANGERVKPTSFRQHVAYVTQDDALFGTSTAREALEFSARLRLPKNTTAETRKQLVDDIIESLGLKKCENTMIGNELVRGLSGGEKKRVAIGVELVSNPACLFLDEPTSGLDSWSAYNVVRILKAISSTGCTTICSIHQPSSEVFHLFDSLVLLGNGSVIFQGNIRECDAAFNALGLGCPPRTNIADHVMHLIQTRPLDKLPSDCENRRRYGGQLPPPVLKLASEDRPKASLKKLGSKLASVGASFRHSNGERTVAVAEASPNFFVQTAWLTSREFKSLYRDRGSLFGRFGVIIFLNILFAILFLYCGDQSRPGYTAQSHFGALVMTFVGAMMSSAQPALLTFPMERTVFIREKATGTYGSIAYVTAKLIVEIPLSFLSSLLIMLIAYWSIRYQGNFFYLTLALWALMLAATSTAYVLGSAAPSVKTAQELLPIVFVPQLLFVGFFVQISQMPIWIQWCQYLCALKYAINLAMIVEFNPNLAINEANKRAYEGLLDYNSVNPSQDWLYSIILLVIFASFRMIALLVLNRKAKQFSS